MWEYFPKSLRTVTFMLIWDTRIHIYAIHHFMLFWSYVCFTRAVFGYNSWNTLSLSVFISIYAHVFRLSIHPNEFGICTHDCIKGVETAKFNWTFLLIFTFGFNTNFFQTFFFCAHCAITITTTQTNMYTHMHTCTHTHQDRERGTEQSTWIKFEWMLFLCHFPSTEKGVKWQQQNKFSWRHTNGKHV